MTNQHLVPRRSFTEGARVAASAARAAKRALPDTFGHPELFVVRTLSGGTSFTWEIRRHGGVVLQKGTTGLASIILAKAEGEHAMALLATSPV